MQWRLPGDPFWGLPYLALVCLLRGISEDTCVCPSFSLLGRKGQSRFRESVRRGFWVTSLGTQTAALEGKDLQLLISSCPSSSFPGSGPGPKLGAVKHCAPKLPACWESTHRTDEHTEHQAQLVLRARTARSCVRSWCSSNATPRALPLPWLASACQVGASVSLSPPSPWQCSSRGQAGQETWLHYLRYCPCSGRILGRCPCRGILYWGSLHETAEFLSWPCLRPVGGQHSALTSSSAVQVADELGIHSAPQPPSCDLRFSDPLLPCFLP